MGVWGMLFYETLEISNPETALGPHTQAKISWKFQWEKASDRGICFFWHPRFAALLVKHALSIGNS